VTLNHPQVARALEQSLTAAMVACLAQDSGQAHGVTWHRHQRVMKAFRDWLDQHLDQPVHLLDMCQALGVPARTLRLCCQEQLGMSPIQYLFLRRMRLARDRLISSDGSTSTVTTVAMDCGFWLGRFSVAYHNLYGERPSATLARPPQPPPGARPFE
jgi:AraC family ethanolamine operon transcriptional activator